MASCKKQVWLTFKLLKTKQKNKSRQEKHHLSEVLPNSQLYTISAHRWLNLFISQIWPQAQVLTGRWKEQYILTEAKLLLSLQI